MIEVRTARKEGGAETPSLFAEKQRRKNKGGKAEVEKQRRKGRALQTVCFGISDIAKSAQIGYTRADREGKAARLPQYAYDCCALK